MNDKKTTYDKLVKHIDKAGKFLDLLAAEQPSSDPYRALEKAMNDYAESVGDRHQAGIVMQGMVAQFVDRSKLAKPLTADEIHAMNAKVAEGIKQSAKDAEIYRAFIENEKAQIQALKDFIDSNSKCQVIWLIEDAASKGFDLVCHDFQPLSKLAKFLAEFFAIGGITPPDDWGYQKGSAADEFYKELMQDIYSTN